MLSCSLEKANLKVIPVATCYSVGSGRFKMYLELSSHHHAITLEQYFSVVTLWGIKQLSAGVTYDHLDIILHFRDDSKQQQTYSYEVVTKQFYG